MVCPVFLGSSTGRKVGQVARNNASGVMATLVSISEKASVQQSK